MNNNKCLKIYHNLCTSLLLSAHIQPYIYFCETHRRNQVHLIDKNLFIHSLPVCVHTYLWFTCAQLLNIFTATDGCFMCYVYGTRLFGCMKFEDATNVMFHNRMSSNAIKWNVCCEWMKKLFHFLKMIINEA